MLRVGRGVAGAEDGGVDITNANACLVMEATTISSSNRKARMQHCSSKGQGMHLVVVVEVGGEAGAAVGPVGGVEHPLNRYLLRQKH
jgi:hypothetical protein